MDPKMLSEIAAGGAISAPSASVEGRGSLSSSMALTQHAIKNLGGPIHASMTDHTPKDTALAQAKTLVAIQKGGEKSVKSAPVDRAIAESHLLTAISSGKPRSSLKSVHSKDTALTAEQLKQLQLDSIAEKERVAAARTFGGGDAKAGMASILSEIQGQGGVIAVPAEKAAVKSDNTFLNQTKTLMEINTLGGEPVFASMQDHKIVDTALVQAQTLSAITNPSKKASLKPSQAPADRAVNEALTMKAITNPTKRDTLKHVEAPDTSLDEAKLKELQKQSLEEKAQTE